MKKFILILMLLPSFLVAQDYEWGIGLRGGLLTGLTVKKFIGQQTAIEGQLMYRNDRFKLTALYEFHGDMGIDGLKYFVGAGAHIGRYDATGSRTFENRHGQFVGVGADAILGLEYTFARIPLNISLDLKPSLNITPLAFLWDEGAFSIRYVF